MKISAGKLNRRITIQQRVGTQDALGQPVETWTDVVSVWADARSTNGLSFIKETIKADAETILARVSFRIRYRSGITEGMRVLHNSVTYDITAVMPDMSDRSHLDLVCEKAK